LFYFLRCFSQPLPLSSYRGATLYDCLHLYEVLERRFHARLISNSPLDMSDCTYLFWGDATYLIVLLDTALVSAIASSVGIIVVAVLMMITMALYSIGVQRSHTKKQRVSVAMPVIDICRPAPSNVDQNSRIAEPQQPQEVYLSPRQPSPSARTASRHEETLRLTGLHCPSNPARFHLDLEAQSWKFTRDKKNAKAELSHLPSCVSPPLELPISPPPSYSQIDKSLLVAAL